MTFAVQPYPLFAVIAAEAGGQDGPPADAVRIVLGWASDTGGVPWPVLADPTAPAGPAGPAVWSGPVTYHETRELAELAVDEAAQATRGDPLSSVSNLDTKRKG